MNYEPKIGDFISHSGTVYVYIGTYAEALGFDVISPNFNFNEHCAEYRLCGTWRKQFGEWHPKNNQHGSFTESTLSNDHVLLSTLNNWEEASRITNIPELEIKLLHLELMNRIEVLDYINT